MRSRTARVRAGRLLARLGRLIDKPHKAIRLRHRQAAHGHARAVGQPRVDDRIGRRVLVQGRAIWIAARAAASAVSAGASKAASQPAGPLDVDRRRPVDHHLGYRLVIEHGLEAGQERLPIRDAQLHLQLSGLAGAPVRPVPRQEVRLQVGSCQAGRSTRGWNSGSRRSLNALLAPTLPVPPPAEPEGSHSWSHSPAHAVCSDTRV